MTALVYGIVHSADAGWGNTVTLLAVAAGALLLGLFVANERPRHAANHGAAPAEKLTELIEGLHTGGLGDRMRNVRGGASTG